MSAREDRDDVLKAGTVDHAGIPAKPSPWKVQLLVTVVLFAVSIVVRYVMGDYPKGIGVLPDEIRYLNLASSLGLDGQLVERGGFSSFQKILYPLSLLPAYLVDDPLVRVSAINLLNSIYVSSALFPALVLARRIFSATPPVIACLLFTFIMPDMCYSMTFLSECVYLPLALWLIACCLVALERRGRARLLWSAGAGLLCYVVYLAKEVALGFALAYLLIVIVRAAYSPKERRMNLASAACFAAGLALPFVLFKLTVFAGLLNSYNQADPVVLLNPYTLLFSLYAFASDATHFAMAFAFFPLVVPLLTLARLTRRERELYLFCLLSLLFILLAVVYTISIREDLGHVGIRPHVRYVAPLFLPLLFLMVKQVVRGDGIAIARDAGVRGAAVCATLLMALLCCLFIGTGDYAQGFDNAQYHILRLAGEQFGALPVDPLDDPSSTSHDGIYHGDWFVINPVTWAAKALCCAYLLLGLWSFLSSRRRRAGTCLLVVIALAMVANSLGAYQYNRSVYEVDQEMLADVLAIESYLDALPPGDQALIVYDDSSSASNNLMDVYLDNDARNCAYILEKDLRDALGRSGDQRSLLLACDATMGDNVFGVNGRTCDENAGIAYVVVNDAQHLHLSAACATDVTPEGIAHYLVYQVIDGAELMLDSAIATLPMRR